MKKIENIIIINKYKLSQIDQKIISSIKNFISTSKFKNDYNFKHWKQKYSIDFILAHIIYLLKYNFSWRTLGSVHSNIYKHYIKLQTINTFKNTYIALLKKYLQKTKFKNLSKVYTDTTFIINKKGTNFMGRNKYMKNKNCNKVSIITDKKFIPIDIQIFKGNVNDSKILQKQMKIILENKDYVNYLFADKGYCSKITKEILNKNNIHPIIDYNNRNTKDKTKKKYLTKNELKLYIKRIYIEHLFGNYKYYPKLGQRYEQKIHNYEGLMYLHFIKKICSL